MPLRDLGSAFRPRSLRIGAAVTVRRGKASSWSTSKEVAETFLNPRTYWGATEGWFLLKVVLQPNQVLLDFSKITVPSLHNDGQGEVLATGKRIATGASKTGLGDEQAGPAGDLR